MNHHTRTKKGTQGPSGQRVNPSNQELMIDCKNLNPGALYDKFTNMLPSALAQRVSEHSPIKQTDRDPDMNPQKKCQMER